MQSVRGERRRAARGQAAIACILQRIFSGPAETGTPSQSHHEVQMSRQARDGLADAQYVVQTDLTRGEESIGQMRGSAELSVGSGTEERGF